MKRIIRQFYWRHIRRHNSEICGECTAGPGQITIHHYGCGRPIGPLWRVPTPLWNFVVADQQQTIMTVREGAAHYLAPYSEGVGGILCLSCFTRAAEAKGIPYLMWRPEGTGDYAS